MTSHLHFSALKHMDFSEVKKCPWYDLTALWRGRYYGTIKIKLPPSKA